MGDGGDDGDVAPGGGFAVVVEAFFGGEIDDHIDGVLFEQLVGGKLFAGVDEAGLVGGGQSEELSDGAVLKSGAAADDPFQDGVGVLKEDGGDGPARLAEPKDAYSHDADSFRV